MRRMQKLLALILLLLSSPVVTSAAVINAAHFDLKCDNVTDNARAFSEAIAKMKPGDFLLIPPQSKPCLVSRAITGLPIGSSLIAIPHSVTIAPTADNQSVPVLLSLANIDNVTIAGITFHGGGSRFPNEANLVQAYHGSKYLLIDVVIKHVRGIGVMFSDVVQSGVRRSAFIDVGNGWKASHKAFDRRQAVAFCCRKLTSSIKNFVENSHFLDIGLDAISVTEQRQVNLIDNRCDINNDQQSYIYSPQGYAACIYLNGVDNILIRGNISYGASGNAFDIVNTSRVVILNNKASASWEAGFGIFGVTTGIIENNISVNNGRSPSSPDSAGFALASYNKDLYFKGNVASDTQIRKTQKFGIFSWMADAKQNINDHIVICKNSVKGNAVSAYGGMAPLLWDKMIAACSS